MSNELTDADDSAVIASSWSSFRLPRNVRLLGWASLLNDVASEAIYPLLPAFLRSLGGSTALLGLLEGLADTVASLLKLHVGAWSDRVGQRKSFIVIGYGLAGLSRPWLAVATHVGHVFTIRLLDRIGKGLRTAPRDAMIAESTAELMRGRAFGYHRAMDHLGAAVGPLIATAFLWCVPGGLRYLMGLTLIPGLIVITLQWIGLRETLPVTATSARSARLDIWPRGPFLIYLIAVLLFTLANSSDAFLLVRAEEVGVTPLALPILWAMLQLAKSWGNRVMGGLADLVAPSRLVMGGWYYYAVVYTLLGLATRAWHMWGLFLAYALFFALTEPAEKKLVTRLAKRHDAGTAFGWFHTALGIANLPSSLFFGWLYARFGAFVAFRWGAAMAVVAALVLACVDVRDKEPIPRRNGS